MVPRVPTMGKVIEDFRSKLVLVPSKLMEKNFPLPEGPPSSFLVSGGVPERSSAAPEVKSLKASTVPDTKVFESMITSSPQACELQPDPKLVVKVELE